MFLHNELLLRWIWDITGASNPAWKMGLQVKKEKLKAQIASSFKVRAKGWGKKIIKFVWQSLYLAFMGCFPGGVVGLGWAVML